jgi:hypothetical protein
VSARRRKPDGARRLLVAKSFEVDRTVVDAPELLDVDVDQLARVVDAITRDTGEAAETRGVVVKKRAHRRKSDPAPPIRVRIPAFGAVAGEPLARALRCSFIRCPPWDRLA